MSISKHTTDEVIMAEWNRQTPQNIRAMNACEQLFDETPGSIFSKLENFAKHVRRQRLSKFLAHAEIFRKILNVHGAVLDLGVNAGQSLFTWAQLSAIWEPINYTRTIIGFDSFAGIPAITAEDLASPEPSKHLKPGGFAFDDIDSLEKAIEAYDGNRSLSQIKKIELIPGDIVETLPQFIEDHQHLVVSLLHLDMDVYRPTRVALESVVPRMPKGAVIVFDELNQIPYPGETKAVMDAVGLRNLRIERLTWETGISYAVLE